MTTEISYHQPVIALLREQGIAAFEEATGGNNYHVCYPHPTGRGHFLADANNGFWVAGAYTYWPDDDGIEAGVWRWAPAAEYDTDLDEDADPALVVAWLLATVR